MNNIQRRILWRFLPDGCRNGALHDEEIDIALAAIGDRRQPSAFPVTDVVGRPIQGTQFQMTATVRVVFDGGARSTFLHQGEVLVYQNEGASLQ